MAREILIIEARTVGDPGGRQARVVTCAFFKTLVGPFLRDGFAYVPRDSLSLPQFVSNRLTPQDRTDIDAGTLLWGVEQVSVVLPADRSTTVRRIKAHYVRWESAIIPEFVDQFADSGTWLDVP